MEIKPELWIVKYYPQVFLIHYPSPSSVYACIFGQRAGWHKDLEEMLTTSWFQQESYEKAGQRRSVLLIPDTAKPFRLSLLNTAEHHQHYWKKCGERVHGRIGSLLIFSMFSTYKDSLVFLLPRKGSEQNTRDQYCLNDRFHECLSWGGECGTRLMSMLEWT